MSNHQAGPTTVERGFMTRIGRSNIAAVTTAVGLAVLGGGDQLTSLFGGFSSVPEAFAGTDPCAGKPNISKVAGIIACESVDTATLNSNVDVQKVGQALKLNIRMVDAQGRLIVHPMRTGWKTIETVIPPKPGCDVEKVGDPKNHDSRTRPGASYLNGWKDNAGNTVMHPDKTKQGDEFQICADGSATKILGHREDGTAYSCHNSGIFPPLAGRTVKNKIPYKVVDNIAIDWSLHPKIRAAWNASLNLTKHVTGKASAKCRNTDGTGQASSSLRIESDFSTRVDVDGTVVAENPQVLKNSALTAANQKLGVTINEKARAWMGQKVSGLAVAKCFTSIAKKKPAAPKKPAPKKPAEPTTSTTPAGPTVQEGYCDPTLFQQGVAMIDSKGIKISFRNNPPTADSSKEFVNWGDDVVTKPVPDDKGNLTTSHVYERYDTPYQATVFNDGNGNGKMDPSEAQGQCSVPAKFGVPKAAPTPAAAPAPITTTPAPAPTPGNNKNNDPKPPLEPQN